MTIRIPRYIPLMALAVALAISLSGAALSAAETTVSNLAKSTHFHGISVDRADPNRLYLATHHGLYVVTHDGRADRISSDRSDYMGFTPHPTNPAMLFASGHPVGGGNLGVISSVDGGKNWKKLSNGVNGPVDFHQMDASKADPNVIFGISGGVQVSRDGGRSWTIAGPTPEGVIDLSASANSADTVYAATRRGIVRSVDGGRSWAPAHAIQRTATMIQVASDGMLYAYLVDTGLIRTAESPLNWRQVTKEFSTALVLHLAVDPTDGRQIYVVTFDPRSRSQAIHATRDGGVSWASLGEK